jgi:protein-tyrosine phosphatase
MPEMVDLHNHALFGVDDGAQTMAICEQMLSSAYAAGVRTVCFTPHYNPSLFSYSFDDLRARFEKVSAFAARRMPGMRLYLGNEVFGYPVCIAALEAGKCLPLGGGHHVLIEFSPSVSYREMRNSFLSCFAAGYTPVLAHVERYRCLYEEPARVFELADMQIGIQVNAESVFFGFPLKIWSFVQRLLQWGLVTVIASDAHDLDKRPNLMLSAYRKIEKKYGPAVAKKLFYSNPKRYLGLN